ncbi:class I SAM-dependent methyltransferase [Streptomyces sp. 4N509B]|uniref:class I SAM-dependent methyltransferase n=1 Tax=Streptomyces sp. 4N509B TaxID=3457413 RepID=UPI003FD08033
MTTNPFLAPDAQRTLYGSAERLGSRTGALHRAKIEGRAVADVIVGLATIHSERMPEGTIADLGCGRGTTTHALARHHRAAQVVGIDASHALLAEARRTTTDAAWVRADFHALPIRSGTCSLVVAAFCLYHSPHPERVIHEIARCLAPGGLAILVTKSANSYRELDEVVASTGLDPHATARPSLYAAAHSGNLSEVAAAALEVRHLEHEEHRFRFHDANHLAAYLATTPKYHITPGRDIAASLPNQPVTATSVVTYLVGGIR